MSQVGYIGQMFTTSFDFVVDAVKFLINFFVDLIFIGDLATSVTGNIPALFSWLPASCVTLLTLCLSVVIVYKIFGRES